MSGRPALVLRGARRTLGATGPWPPGRVLRAVGALLAAVPLLALPARIDPRVAALAMLPSLAGLVFLALALLRARAALLAPALVLLGVPAAGVVTGAPAGTAAGAGVALVAVAELARWSIERRVDVPGERAGEPRRWAHLAVVLGAGWTVGVAVVALGAGRLDGAVHSGALAAAAAVAVAAAVVALARR